MVQRDVRVPFAPRWVRWLVALAVTVVLFAASVVRPPASAGTALPSAWFHAVGYAVLALALAYALHRSRPTWQVVCVAFALATVYGVGIELVQSTLAYRAFEVGDIVVNAVGAAVAVAGWRLAVSRVRFYRVGVRPRK